MIAKKRPAVSRQMDRAITELKGILAARYPNAVFRIAPDPEESEAVDLIVTVDVDDIDEVLDVVIDRLVELQVEEDLPVHVLPVQPIERVLKELGRPTKTGSRSPS